eukprot:TRINITY_DN6381_c0_g1_i1.p1 TRINITY_DN6381_c0_g1~~TRINITY_DN6381_c0_g1_i1.p1  ORF type:complete len:564 (+),score=132.75 TRINITY_DN6381_c0_g1_i1:34-1725(+)
MNEKETKAAQGLVFLARGYKVWNAEIEDVYEMFYDPLQKRVVVLQGTNVYAFEKYERMKDPNPVYFQLPAKHPDADALAISHDDCFVAVQDNPSRIAFVDFGPVITEEFPRSTFQAKESEVDLDPTRGNVLALSFMKSPYFDLAVCFTEGIDIYKHNVKKRSLEKPLKVLSFSTLNVWINPGEGFVALSSAKSKGEVFVFNLEAHEVKAKEVKGSNLHLTLRPFDSPSVNKAERQQKDLKALKYYLEVPEALTKNLKQYGKRISELEKMKAEGYQEQKLILTKLYNHNFLLHYNQIHGIIELYKLTIDKARKLLNTIELDPTCEYSLHVSDNLLFALNGSKERVTVYDAKDMEEFQSPLCEESGVDLEHLEAYTCDNIELLSDVEAKEEAKEVELDDVGIKNNRENGNLGMEEIKNAIDLLGKQKPKTIQFEIKNCIYIDHDITFYPSENQFYTFLLNKVKYLHSAEKKVHAILNIMRRSNTKTITLAAIKYIVEQGISLHKLSKLFAAINTTLQVAEDFQIATTPPHEVKRITNVVTQSEEQPAIYLSRVEPYTASVLSVNF